MLKAKLLITFLLLFIIGNIFSQDSANVSQVSSKYFDVVIKKSNSLDQSLDRRSEKALTKMQNHEARLQRKLAKIDSLAATNLFEDSKTKYQQLRDKLNNPQIFSQYIPHLDTLTTSFKFLEQNRQWLTNVKDAKEKFDEATSKLKELQGKLQSAENIKQFLKERREFLKQQFEKFGFAKELKKINKEVYYYSQQINEYREILKDSKKAERKAIELLSKTKLFRDFMRKNSLLASMFRLPDDQSSGANFAVLSGLQTRSQVTALIQNQIANGGPNSQQLFQQNIQQAQSQLNQIKERVLRIGNSANGGEMPEGFKPNDQKTKKILDRLEFGSNLQTQRARYMFPVTSDLGLFLGYKLNNESIIGIGASYKMGWGSGFNNIRITHQGIGMRSFIDWKIKGSFWISGGYEQNYRSEIRSIDQLRDQSAWQQSGLLGVSKVLSTNTKFFKKTKIQLLWDFLSYQQIPRTQPILFRVGYNF